MSATKDVQDYLGSMEPGPGESVESFAKRGLAWQAEIYSSNAGGDIRGLEWDEIGEANREQWREWARKRGAV